MKKVSRVESSWERSLTPVRGQRQEHERRLRMAQGTRCEGEERCAHQVVRVLGSDDHAARLSCRNFTKFLIDRQGNLVGRYGSGTKPEALKSEIEKVL